MGRPTTIEEAAQRTDQLMTAGRDALSPDLKFGEGTNDNRSRCEDGSGAFYATRSLLLVGADPGKFGQYHSRIRDWWQNNGFKVTSEDPDPSSGMLIATNDDGFKMKLATNDNREAFLGVSSPCV